MELEKNKIVVIATLALQVCISSLIIAKKKKRTRRFKVRPMNRNRDQNGFFASVLKEMRTMEVDSDQHFKYMRMTKEMYEQLLQLVGPSLQKNKKKYHLTPDHRLAMTIHYLASGSSMQELAWTYKVGKATVHVIVKETCIAIWNILSPTQLPSPSQVQWRTISQEYFERWNMPNCLGAIDGKHINIQAPANSGSEFFNYKKHFSLVLMAACDSYYRFTLVDVGASGSNHDSMVFRNSRFGKAIITKRLNIPSPKNLPGSDIKTNYFFVADAAFPLHINIMKPYSNPNLDETKLTFNYRLSRARRTIENAFGILCQRWRILRKPIIANIDVCEYIVLATLVLHNFLQSSEKHIPLSERKYCPTGFTDKIDSDGVLHLGSWREDFENLKSVNRLASNNYTRNSSNQRDLLADYCTSKEGWISWQEERVARGSIPNLY